MDAARFDFWTRRRFGFAAGGLAAQIEALREANARLAARVTQLEAAGQT